MDQERDREGCTIQKEIQSHHLLARRTKTLALPLENE